MQSPMARARLPGKNSKGCSAQQREIAIRGARVVRDDDEALKEQNNVPGSFQHKSVEAQVPNTSAE